MWSEFKCWWGDFKAGREGARYLLGFVVVIFLLVWFSV